MTEREDMEDKVHVYHAFQLSLKVDKYIITVKLLVVILEARTQVHLP